MSIKRIKTRTKIILSLIIIISLAFIFYRTSKINLLDKEAYNNLVKQIEEESQSFTTQDDLMDFIKSWADSNNIDYRLDKNGNIIIEKKAIERKKDVSPTIVLVNCNYDDAYDSRNVITSAAMIASSNIKAGKYTVVFINNVNNSDECYNNLDRSIFSNQSKVIYIDTGKSTYISTNSYERTEQTISVPSKTESVKCDTAVKVSISGIDSDTIGTSIGSQPSPISLLSTILNKIRSKSYICQVADINIGNRGNMYPDSLEVTFLINSYSVESFTGYLDKRIKAFDKAYKKDFPNAQYTYEIINDTKDFPKKAYTQETLDSLTTLLYALKNGNYRFEDDAVLPSGYEADDIYAINCVRQLRIDESNNILIDVSTHAYDKNYTQQIIDENKEVCKLSNCKLSINKKYSGFKNDSNSLVLSLKNTYMKTASFSIKNFTLKTDTDKYFTPMSYLREINNKMDIVHVKTTAGRAKSITSMILCYIQTSGNFLSL